MVGTVQIGIRGLSVRRLVAAAIVLFGIVPALAMLLLDVAPESIPVIGGVFLLILSLLQAAVGVLMVVGAVIWIGVSVLLIYGMRNDKLDDWEWFPVDGPESMADAEPPTSADDTRIDLPSVSTDDVRGTAERTKRGVEAAWQTVAEAREQADVSGSSSDETEVEARPNDTSQRES